MHRPRRTASVSTSHDKGTPVARRVRKARDLFGDRPATEGAPMHVRPSTPRLLLLAVLLLGALVCTATANAGKSRVVATAAAVHHAQVDAKAAGRTGRTQQSAGARACAKHNKKLSRASRARLLKSSARLSHLRKVLTGLTGSGSTPSTPSAPTSGTSGS